MVYRSKYNYLNANLSPVVLLITVFRSATEVKKKRTTRYCYFWQAHTNFSLLNPDFLISEWNYQTLLPEFRVQTVVVRMSWVDKHKSHWLWIIHNLRYILQYDWIETYSCAFD